MTRSMRDATTGDGAIVRPGETRDVAALRDIYNHHVRTSNATFDVAPLTLDQRLEWFSQYALSGRHRLFVAVRDGVVLGYATSSVFRPRAAYAGTVESSVYLRPDATRQGLGTRLYRALFDAIAGEDIHRIIAVVALPNPGSIALHGAFGFHEVGRLTEVGRKFDRWWDVVLLEKRVLQAPGTG